MSTSGARRWAAQSGDGVFLVKNGGDGFYTTGQLRLGVGLILAACIHVTNVPEHWCNSSPRRRVSHRVDVDERS